MARGYIRIGSNGRISSGVVFSLFSWPEDVTPHQWVRAICITPFVLFSGYYFLTYRVENSVAHRALQLVPENTLADQFKNNELRARAARENRPLLEVGDFVSWDDRIIRHGDPAK